MKSVELSLFADFHQFYVQDEAAEGDLSGSWTKEASSRLLAIAPGTIGVGTVRNMHVPVTIEVHDREPENDFSDWDHVVEAALEVTSGRIAVAGCMDNLSDAKRIELPPGSYRVRVSYGALDTLSKDGLDGQDHYRVQLWPGSPTAVRVVKQWTEPQHAPPGMIQ